MDSQKEYIEVGAELLNKCYVCGAFRWADHDQVSPAMCQKCIGHTSSTVHPALKPIPYMELFGDGVEVKCRPREQ